MTRKIIKAIDSSFRFVEEWSLFSAVCIALLTAMANVILRKTTDNFSLYWSDEIVRKVIFFSTYVGCIAAVRTRSLIRIDALPQMLPVLKKPLTIISHLGVLVFAGIMVYLGFQMTSMMYQDEYAQIHQQVQLLVAEDVPVHVCATHASWYAVSAEDFPEYVNVAPTGPGQIELYLELDYELIVIQSSN